MLSFPLTTVSFIVTWCSICGGGYPCFELSAVNADKPPLTVSEIKDRVKQFEKVGEYVHYHCNSEEYFRIKLNTHIYYAQVQTSWFSSLNAWQQYMFFWAHNWNFASCYSLLSPAEFLGYLFVEIWSTFYERF